LLTPARVGCRSVSALSVALAAFLLNACSINPPLNLSEMYPGQPRIQLSSVPFYPQEAYQCGPAALAGVLGAAGVDIAPSNLAPQVFLPGRQGSLQLELMGASRRANRIPYIIDGAPGSLFAQLQAGRPVLVLQNLQTRDFPVWHFAVLVGFDAQSNRVYLNSGSKRGLELSAPSFLRTWDWAGRWAMVVLRPGEMPEDVALSPYLDAVATFEEVVGGVASEPAWEAAVRQWPLDGRPYLALGNLAYTRGDLRLAMHYYGRGLALSPGDPALGNNLASVLGEMGCPEEGRARLEPILEALPAGSNWELAMQGTLAELLAQRQLSGAACNSLYPGK